MFVKKFFERDRREIQSRVESISSAVFQIVYCFLLNYEYKYEAR